MISKRRRTNKQGHPVFAPADSSDADSWRKYRAEEPKHTLASSLSREERDQESGKVVQIHGEMYRRKGNTEPALEICLSTEICACVGRSYPKTWKWTIERQGFKQYLELIQVKNSSRAHQTEWKDLTKYVTLGRVLRRVLHDSAFPCIYPRKL